MTKSTLRFESITAVFLILVLTSLVYAQSKTSIDDESKQHDIKKLMELRKVQEIINERTANNMAYCLKTYPEFPMDIWLNLIGGPKGKVIYDTIYEVYNDNLTAEEVRTLLEAQSSQELTKNPDLMRLVIKLDPIMMKSVDDMVRKLIKKLQPELKKYGYEVSEDDLYKQITGDENNQLKNGRQDKINEPSVSR